MNRKEIQKLDLNETYPCPSCKQGCLVPITLTEAWGCDRCKQIFELQSEPDTISKISNPYHRKRLWQWDGKQWIVNSRPLKPIVSTGYFWIGCFLLLGFFWLGWSLLGVADLSQLVRVALVLLLVVMFWVVLRR